MSALPVTSTDHDLIVAGAGVRRVMGIETEYGISVPGAPHANAMVLSGRVVRAYAAQEQVEAARPRWDYSNESPLHDARGFDVPRGAADPSQLTDVPADDDDITLANVVLTNGARLYVDHAHPEYSSPEVTSPRAGLIWDRAGERIMQQAVRVLAQQPPGINLYKNNIDGKGASYGTHENYLVKRSVPFETLVAGLLPFFVARQIYCGSGRVGLGPASEHAGYQLTQRADYIERKVGLETTLRRPMINTRDEPHADPEVWRRLHIIIGDANHGDVPTLLKLGTTALVLGMIEHGTLGEPPTLRHPVTALHAVSRDPSLAAKVELADGRFVTALDLCEFYLERSTAHVAARQGNAIDPDTAEVLTQWERVLTTLRSDPARAAADVDWIAKLVVLERYRARLGDGPPVPWDHPRLRAIDIQWSDVRPDKGLFHVAAARGMTRLVDDAAVEAAVTTPPEDTRAWSRGSAIRATGPDVVAASWESVSVYDRAADRVHRLELPDPLGHTRALTDAALAGSASGAEVLARWSTPRATPDDQPENQPTTEKEKP
ncbi:depupylase/deamidase Dop [Kribbia dieselivorans]|uniref:depupylase/deamidase Dop n=1 Tax=Kribbia dieselivorans TaxID=331526 RepID=UPI000A7F65DE|nr:depupylase/deamidase Dop [Kribbia dieselivorans]